MSNELRVDNLNFETILKDINLNLPSGTISALMGKSGSGKTLFLKSFFGLIQYSGEISYDGTIIVDENRSNTLKDFGLYLDIDHLDNKTVFLNLIEPLNNLGFSDSKAKKKVYEISKKFEIDFLLYKEVSSLSYSQKKLVAYIQSIIHEPKVILIDNLFDSMDSCIKNKIVKYLKELKKKNCIIIFITSNSEDLMFADNLILIKNGRIIENGSVKNLIQNETLFLKNDIKLPFLIDLSYKLKAYDLIDDLIFDYDKMVDEIWK